MNEEKTLAYAIAYLESKIEEHEKFLSQFSYLERMDYAQYRLVERYKKEKSELEYKLSKI